MKKKGSTLEDFGKDNKQLALAMDGSVGQFKCSPEWEEQV